MTTAPSVLSSVSATPPSDTPYSTPVPEAATGPLRVRYQTIEFSDTDIHLCTLRDRQQFSDPDGEAEGLGISSAQWPLFGQVWPSSFVLAHYMDDYQTEGKRILELGCGMALSSLLLHSQDVDITATDYHPEVGTFLKRNALLNSEQAINYERVDWADETDTLGRFDMIIGSDILYEDQHIELLSSFIENHANPSCEIILVDPNRGRKNKFSEKMQSYGFEYEQFTPSHDDYLSNPFKCSILQFRRG